MSGEVRIADRDQVRWIEIDRPGSRNGLTIEVNQRIIEAVRDPGDARALVLTGGGGHFCSGLDLKDAMSRGLESPEQTEARMRAHFHGLIRAIRALPIPTIAAVDGGAVGFGCDLALACDLRLVSDRARFGEIFVKRGLIPDGGGTYLLPRLIGLGRALELMFTGRMVEADEAVRIGLASAVHPHTDLADRTADLAAQLAAGPPIALRLIKQSVYAALDGDLDAALEREVTGQLECLGSDDFTEGVTAFFQKRPPSFSGS